MKIAIADHQLDAEYLRHARLETLKSVCVSPNPSLVNILPMATYLLAYDDHGQPIGMAESAMLDDVYASYDDAPYSQLCDLNSFCPLNQMASIRTVFVEPEHRCSAAVFLSLTFGSAMLFHGMGARFATATTRSSDDYLNRLYQKCGGQRVGTFSTDQTNEQSSLFVFDLEKALKHRVMRRLTQSVSFTFGKQLETA